MNNEPQSMSVSNILHQLTSPWLNFILAPLGYCLIGLLLAVRQQQFHFTHFSVLFLFFVIIYLQENSFRKFANHPELKRWIFIAITDILLLSLLVYFYQNVALRIVLLLLLIVILNHGHLFELKTNDMFYIYHSFLNSISKYYLGNFITLFILSGAVSKEICIQLFQYILFGLYVSHVKSRLVEIREGIRHYGPVVAICTVLFSLSWLIGTIIYFVWYLGSFSILGTILFSLSLLIPILYQIYYRKEFSVNRQFTYLHWYLIVMSFLYGFFFII